MEFPLPPPVAAGAFAGLNEGVVSMRKIALSLGLAAVTGASLFVISPAATAAESGTQAACFTLWQTANYNDGSRTFSANDANFNNNNWSNGQSSNDDANSARNRCSHRVFLYADAGYSGQSYYLQANSNDGDFGNNAFSNKASSLNGF
ncbi:hypothetical protein [Streptomyces sp. NPDC051567]|uniref:hypothetical protein n=1 Tax=Streptomyces sp. NPDC051567 TaxID=3365660 RepID=UPI0037B3C41D